MARSFTRGFSLVELMVVISIVAVLMGVGAVAYTTAQQKARDSVRKTDIQTIQKALEQYYVANGRYPTGAGCTALASATDYLPAGIPTDPRPSSSYRLTCDATGSTYCVCAALEDNEGNSVGNNCAFNATGTKNNYCLVNQQ